MADRKDLLIQVQDSTTAPFPFLGDDDSKYNCPHCQGKLAVSLKRSKSYTRELAVSRMALEFIEYHAEDFAEWLLETYPGKAQMIIKQYVSGRLWNTTHPNWNKHEYKKWGAD